MMNFDYTLQIENIDYGFIKGTRQIVFIKTGLGGNCSGYENKYLNMAHRLYKKHGCSVIVASNPNTDKSHSATDKQIIERYIKDNEITQPELFFFGYSNGGTKGLALANVGVSFTKMIVINMPLMINFHKTKEYLSAIPKTDVVLIYGELDASFPYVPFLKGKLQNINILTIPKADHNFSGMLNEFIDLGDMLFHPIT